MSDRWGIKWRYLKRRVWCRSSSSFQISKMATNLFDVKCRFGYFSAKSLSLCPCAPSPPYRSICRSRVFDRFDDLDKIPSGSYVCSPLGHLCVFRNLCHWMRILLLDFLVYSYFLEDRVELLEFKTVRGILTVLLGHITWCTRETGCFMLGAFQNDLMPVAFWLLCHVPVLLRYCCYFLSVTPVWTPSAFNLLR